VWLTFSTTGTRLNENYASWTVYFGELGGKTARAAMRAKFESGN